MHPRIDLHPACATVWQKLRDCHDDHPVAKFVGYCNAEKKALDDCMMEDWQRAKERALIRGRPPGARRSAPRDSEASS